MDPSTSPTYYLRARWVVPMNRPPLEDGGLAINGSRLQWVGPWKDRPEPHSHHQLDLGEVIVLPGLINSHAHLEFTSLSGFHPHPKSFVEWISRIQKEKEEFSPDAVLASWKLGQIQLLQSGVTSVINHESQTTLLPDLWAANKLRLWSCLEMTGILAGTPPEKLLDQALQTLAHLPHSPLLSPGLAPHAPYSTAPQVLSLCQKVARQRNWVLSSHLAESLEESECFLTHTGALAEWLLPLHPGLVKKGSSPVQYALENGLLGPNLLAVHCNYLSPSDLDILAKKGVHVVHCPNSHRYFRHHPFPLKALLERRIPLLLGTDSSATLPARGQIPNPSLNLFHELQILADEHPELSPKVLLDMVTLNPARFLRHTDRMGCLQAGSYADWIALPMTQTGNLSPYETILWNTKPVVYSMIHGSWVARNI